MRQPGRHGGTDGGRDNQAVGGPAPAPDMVRILAGTFAMGSDSHYPQEAPRAAGLQGRRAASFVLSSQRLAMLLPIMTAPITSRTTTMIVTLFSTSHSRSLSNGPRIRADATR
jgi:hypothetical protein